MLPFLLLTAAVTFHFDFEGGSLARVERLSPTHFAAHVRGDVDQDKRNRQANWYYFRIDGARGVALTIDLTDLPGEYNYRPNRGAITGDTLPFISEDRETWRPLDTAEYDESTPRLRFRLTPLTNRVWIAHQPPYTNATLAALLTRVRSHPDFRIASAGKSPQGRDIPLLTIGAGSRTVWLMFRQHAWEAGSSWSGEGAIEYLLSSEAAALRRSATFKILPLCDPDGVAAGRVRFNAAGYDLNRNWDTPDPRLTPEIDAQRRVILAGPVDMLVSLHNTETSEYVEGPPGAEFAPLLERFEAALNRSPVFQSTRKPTLAASTTTEGKPGRMTVVQGLYHDRKIPAFLIEQRISRHHKSGRIPGVQDRKQFGADLVRAVKAALNL